MRELTQQEIDNAPDWADSYFVATEGYEYWVNSERSHLEAFRNPGAKFKAWEECQYLVDKAKPIQRKTVTDDWIKHDGSKRIEPGRYWVMSSYGVRLAGYHDWGACFQDSHTNNDEGMIDTRGNKFAVSHYQPIVEPEPPVECAE